MSMESSIVHVLGRLKSAHVQLSSKMNCVKKISSTIAARRASAKNAILVVADWLHFAKSFIDSTSALETELWVAQTCNTTVFRAANIGSEGVNAQQSSWNVPKQQEEFQSVY